MKDKVICKRCVYDNHNIKVITFDNEGVCNYCHQMSELKNEFNTGTEIGEEDLYGMTKEEVYELVQDNPMGVSEWIHDLVYQNEIEE